MSKSHLPQKYIVNVPTSQNFEVRTTNSYWQLICLKHPEVSENLNEIKECLSSSEQIRQSKLDLRVFLFYKRYDKYWLCVVCKKLNGKGFIITSYWTDKIKEGKQIWQKLK